MEMVYYNDSLIYFPRVSAIDYYVDSFYLRLHRPNSGKEYEYLVEDKEHLRDYIVIDGSILSDLPDGEYEYSLGKGVGIFRKGRIITPSDQYYTKQDNNVIEYNG